MTTKENHPIMSTTASYQTKFVYMNVGGKEFATSRDTIEMYPRGFLAAQLDFMDTQSQFNSKQNPIHVDRDPTLFYHILEFCRTGKLYMPENCTYDKMRDELDFWGLSDYILEADIKPLNIKKALYKKSMENTDKIVEEFVNAVIHSPYITDACEHGMFSVDVPLFQEKDDVLKYHCCSTYFEWINSIYVLAVTPDKEWSDLSHYIPSQDEPQEDQPPQGQPDEFVELKYNVLAHKTTETFQVNLCDMLDMWREVDEYLFNKIVHQIVELRNIFKGVSALNNAMNQLYLKESRGTYEQYTTTMAYFLENHVTFNQQVYRKHCAHILERYEPFRKVADLTSYAYVEDLLTKLFEKGNLDMFFWAKPKDINAVRSGNLLPTINNGTINRLPYQTYDVLTTKGDIINYSVMTLKWDKEKSFIGHWATKMDGFLVKYPNLALEGPNIIICLFMVLIVSIGGYSVYRLLKSSVITNSIRA